MHALLTKGTDIEQLYIYNLGGNIIVIYHNQSSPAAYHFPFPNASRIDDDFRSNVSDICITISVYQRLAQCFPCLGMIVRLISSKFAHFWCPPCGFLNVNGSVWNRVHRKLDDIRQTIGFYGGWAQVLANPSRSRRIMETSQMWRFEMVDGIGRLPAQRSSLQLTNVHGNNH